MHPACSLDRIIADARVREEARGLGRMNVEIQAAPIGGSRRYFRLLHIKEDFRITTSFCSHPRTLPICLLVESYGAG